MPPAAADVFYFALIFLSFHIFLQLISASTEFLLHSMLRYFRRFAAFQLLYFRCRHDAILRLRHISPPVLRPLCQMSDYSMAS